MPRSERQSPHGGTVPPGQPRTIALQCERSRQEYASKTQEEKLTQNQLQELLETEPARVLLEGAEERGFVLPAELEAFALEHDLADDEVEQLTRELETNGLEVRELPPRSRGGRAPRRRSPPRSRSRRPSSARPTACSSSWPTSAGTSC